MLILLSIPAALIASVFYGFVVNERHLIALSDIQNCASPELIDEILLALSNKRVQQYGYHVEHILSKSSDNLFYLKIRYRYTKIISTHSLRFRVTRIRNKEEKENYNNSMSEIDREYIKNELYQYTVETALSTSFSEERLRRSIGLNGAWVGGRPATITSTTDRMNEITWIVGVDSEVDISEPVLIEYTCSLPVEGDDFRYVQLEHPTKGLEITFIRDSSCSDTVDAEAFELITGSNSSAYVAEEPSLSRHRIVRSGWIMPKCGAGFYWYPK